MPQGAYKLSDAKPIGAYRLDEAQPEPAAPHGGLSQTYADLGKGILKGAARTGIGLAEMASQSGMVPGLSIAPGLTERARQAMEYTNPAQQIGGYAETAAELAPSAMALGRGVMGAAKSIPGAARDALSAGASAMADERPLLTQIRQAAAKKILSHVLDFTKKPVHGARVVPRPKDASIETELTKALEELRAPEAATSVELPPQAELPAGYEPRTTAPEYAPPPPAPQGRLVPAAPRPSVEQQVADALAESRKPAMPSVTTPPALELPPGYQPRTHGPRNYFLRTEAVAPETPSVSVERLPQAIADLPESWKGFTAPPVIAPRKIDGSGLAAAFQQELIRRGVKPSQAIQMVLRNNDLPADVKATLVKALEVAARQK